jgi:uncharacterized membrane protein
VFGTWVGWGIVVASSSLCGVGIYLGRVLRWNSWDALTNPFQLVGSVFKQIQEPNQALIVIGFSGVFASIMLLSYLMLPKAELS